MLGELVQHIVGEVGLVGVEATGAEAVCHVQALKAIVLNDTGQLLYKEILKVGAIFKALQHIDGIFSLFGIVIQLGMVADPFSVEFIIQGDAHNAHVRLNALLIQIVYQGFDVVVSPILAAALLVIGACIVAAVIGMQFDFLIQAVVLQHEVGVEQENRSAVGGELCTLQERPNALVFFLAVKADHRHPGKNICFSIIVSHHKPS